ncbi:MAG TPA: twin-arginine translocase TatA/TatE family subunit [Armatimonadota bacterium]|jgi:sec-independent protein translocase protein TatA
MTSLFSMVGIQEAWPIILVIFILFGAKRLPEMARSLGQSVTELKNGMREGFSEEEPAAEKPASEPTTKA